MPDVDDLLARTTSQPQSANVRVARSSGSRRLTKDEQTDLAVDLYSLWETTRTTRQPLNDNIAARWSMYEMEVCETDWPWVGAANLVLPIIPAELDTMKSNIAAQVFVQRLIIVSPGDDSPEAASAAPKFEQFYNSEIRRIRRDGKTPLEHFKTMLHLGLLDGTAPCDVLFSERQEPKMLVTQEPKVEDGEAILDPETGKPEMERVVTRVTETVREVNVYPYLLKEWYLVPDESVCVQDAPGILTVQWMMEKQLREKAKEVNKSGNGEFYDDAIEQVLQWVTGGISDVSRDVEGSYDKTAGQQLNIGQGQGPMTSKFFKNRGPVKILRLLSDQFGLNDDSNISEKNIFYFYGEQALLIGWEPYEYVDDSWPSLAFAPLPRPLRPYGYSLVERLADLVADANAGRNQRRNYIDLCMMPLLLQREGDTVRDKDRAFFPGATWLVENPGEGPGQSLRWFVPPPLTPDSFSDEGRIDVYVSKLTGQNAPALGAQSSGRRSATESRQQQAAQTVRAADVAMDFRAFLRGVMQKWHKLNKQYFGADPNGMHTQMPPEVAQSYQGAKPGELTIPAELLGLPMNIDIAGLSDPMDANTRQTQTLAMIGVAQKAFPWVFQDPVLSYNTAEWFFDGYFVPAVQRFIGTPQDALQRKQTQEAMMQAQLAQQQGGQGAPPGGPPGGAPAGPPQNGAGAAPAGVG